MNAGRLANALLRTFDSKFHKHGIVIGMSNDFLVNTFVFWQGQSTNTKSNHNS